MTSTFNHALHVRRALSVLLGSLIIVSAQAATVVRGIAFPDTVECGQQTLQLNGAGVRVKVIFDIYAASLYLPRKQSSAETALGLPGPKSVQAVMLRDLTSDEFVGAMIKGFKDNNSASDQARLAPQLERLQGMMQSVGKAPKGTVLRLDFVPGSGTRITVDGQVRGADIPGDDFYQALMRIWLGPKPVDADLKSALLGGK